MSSEDAAARLKRTALRDFGPPRSREDLARTTPSHRVTFMPHEAPVPVLLRYALTLIGLKHSGPGEKVAWWVTFTYKGHDCELAHQKFGLRLWMACDTEEEAKVLLGEMKRKLISAVRVVEKVLAANAPQILNKGNVTVANQHYRLRRAYNYFRERALNPDLVEDKTEYSTHEWGSSSLFTHGAGVMAMNASHDMIAAITAYLSCLEHELVLALPFLDYDPQKDDLLEIIGSRWGEKWKRVVGHTDPKAVRLRERLTDVVERWRNPYSHGGFEKGHTATIYLHMPGIGALPVGMTDVRHSPMFMFHSVGESTINDVFALFDEIDAWMVETMPHVRAWIESGLDVRFDAIFMAQVVGAMETDGNLDRLIEVCNYQQDQIDNMDF